jgi:tetratricopeptide (TPR) repeat protein
MQEKTPLKKILEDILQKETFEKLRDYANPNMIKSMSSEEVELLAEGFLNQSKKNLEGHEIDKALEALDNVSQLAPNNLKLMMKQVSMLRSNPNNKLFLLRASKLLEEITQIEPKHFEAWSSWGTILLNMGILTKDIGFLYDADSRFKTAFGFWMPPINKQEAEFFWHWGLCWQMIAKHSGEATDYTKAIGKYKQAVEDGLNDPRFWNGYGNALYDLAELITRSEMILDAIECYRKAITGQPMFPEAWFNISSCYFRMYQNTMQEEYFHLSNTSYEEASHQDPTNPIVWYKWGLLSLYAGKVIRNETLIKNAIERFELADKLEPSNSLFLSAWAESNMLIGSQQEKIDSLKEAEQKIIEALEISPEEPYYWYVYGTTLNEIARYFGDEKYYKQAIEKYQYGISLDRTDHLLWYGLALAHFALGEMQQDEAMIEKAVKFCSRVIEFGGDMLPHFWNDWGVALMKLGVMKNDQKTIEQAVEKFEQAIVRHNDRNSNDTLDAEWLYNYGCALDFLGDFNSDEHYYEKAVQVLSQAITLDPTYGHARYNLALALTHLGEVTGEAECFFKACDIFQSIIQNDREDEMTWNDWGLALIHLAHLIHDPGQPDVAQKLYNQAESKLMNALALGNSQALYNLACLHALTNNFHAAMHYLEKSDTADTLPPYEDLVNDEWLDNLRTLPHFRHFMNILSHKPKKKEKE